MNENLTIKGSLKLRCWKNKDGYDCRALCIDLGYTTKFLTFKTADIAEMLEVLPRDLDTRFPVPTERKIFKEYDISLVK